MKILSAVVTLALMTGCQLASLESRVTPGRSLSQIHKVYVERSNDEDWGFHREIADQFAAAGFRASSGEAGQASAGTDALVTYYDHWFWDMSPYLLELNIRLLDPKDRSVIAWSKDQRTSLVRSSPAAMTRECIIALKNAPVNMVNQPSNPAKIVTRQP